MLASVKAGLGLNRFPVPVKPAGPPEPSVAVPGVTEDLCNHLMVTWNVQGCSLSINDVWDFVTMEHPSVVVLTEVKRANGTMERLSTSLGMKHFSTCTGEGKKAGVIVYASPRLGTPVYVWTPPELKGYVQELSFPQVHGTGFRLFGVYMPPGSEEASTRKALIRYLDKRVQHAGDNGELVAVGGDFNPDTSKYSGTFELTSNNDAKRVARSDDYSGCAPTPPMQ